MVQPLCMSMWLAPHWHNQLLLLLCTTYHSYGQDLDDIVRAKRIIFHFYNPKDMGEIAIRRLSLCIWVFTFDHIKHFSSQCYALNDFLFVHNAITISTHFRTSSFRSWCVLCQVKNQEKGAGVDQIRAEYPKAYLAKEAKCEDGLSQSGGDVGEQLEGAG